MSSAPSRLSSASTPLVERHYVLPDSTKNLGGVATEVSREVYERMARTILIISGATGRGLGKIKDYTRYYEFKGDETFLVDGLAQVGKATTTDNPSGFDMIRLFANSPDAMGRLEQECGRHAPEAAIPPVAA